MKFNPQPTQRNLLQVKHQERKTKYLIEKAAPKTFQCAIKISGRR